MRSPILTLEIRTEHDVVSARQRARQIAELLGFAPQEQTRIATAVSEIARNTFAYAGGGRVEYGVEGEIPEQWLHIRFDDQGPGIADPQAILDGRYTSPTGMGLGIVGARRIMDHFQLASEPGRGTEVVLGKRLPPGVPAVDQAAARRIADELAGRAPRNLFEEVQRQNRELLQALAELRARQDELLQLNRELEDTNRGVVALYAELDERLEQLRRANTLRAQFTSYLSHEFRTPLDSMLALSGLLLNRVDGDLTEEQERQVGYIRRSARDLLNMVDDMLDTARVEAGQLAVRAARFTIAELFNALRSTLRPLLTSDSVALHFDDPGDLPPLHTDEAKVSQILRNLISNALKFTQKGEIRVEALLDGEQKQVTFRVRDTGIGIPAEDLDRIFEDFAQVDGKVQRKYRGTGLGLPLSRKLARLLGGEITVRSTPGEGSLFAVTLPCVYQPAATGTEHETVGSLP